jgi:hypothetical protein
MRYPRLNGRELNDESKRLFRKIKRIVRKNIALYVLIANIKCFRRADIENLSYNSSFGILCDVLKKGK